MQTGGFGQRNLPGKRVRVRAALEVDGPSVVSIECSADEVPPFAPFLSQPPRVADSQTDSTTHQTKETTDVFARA
jgi:acetolactate synthase I/II/III large subunit